MSAAATAKYVYGVVPAAATAPRADGIGRRRVQMLQDGELAAIVSDVPGGVLEAGREELVAHSRVLEQAREQGVVLPMRFGVVMPDETAVRTLLLEDHREQLTLQLQELTGRSELHLCAVYEQDAILGEIVAADEQIAALSAFVRDRPADAVYPERIELGRRVADGIAQAAAADLAAILAALEHLALAVEIGEPDQERIAANLAFLVEDERIEEFDAAVDELGRANQGRMVFRYTGPLPPYSFVELPGHE